MAKQSSVVEFIKKAKLIHGSKFDYSKTEYINARTKVIILCKIHGVFHQMPSMHLRGHGCKQCAGGVNGKSYSKNGIPLYDTFSKQLSQVGIETNRNKNDKNILEVSCHLCKEMHIPKFIDVVNKIRAANGKVNGENNLYCSEVCKIKCPTFAFNPYQQIDKRSKLAIKDTDQKKARNCQTNNLKQLQCDEKGYNYCEKCGDIIDVELHHTLKISRYGNDAINPAGHMLLCMICHTEIHNKCK